MQVVKRVYQQYPKNSLACTVETYRACCGGCGEGVTASAATKAKDTITKILVLLKPRVDNEKFKIILRENLNKIKTHYVHADYQRGIYQELSWNAQREASIGQKTICACYY